MFGRPVAAPQGFLDMAREILSGQGVADRCQPKSFLRNAVIVSINFNLKSIPDKLENTTWGIYISWGRDRS